MLLDKIRETLRITHNKLDNEIQDMIDACKNDMRISGITKIDEEDPLVLQAIKTYCKREYESDMNKRDRYDLAYDSIIKHMGLTKEYGEDVFVKDTDRYTELKEKIASIESSVETKVADLENDTIDMIGKTVDLVGALANKVSEANEVIEDAEE